MKKYTILFLLLSALLVQAQTPEVKRNCGTVVPSKAWDDWFNARVEEFKKSQAQNKELANYTIPVIFHVIHGGQSIGSYPNLSQAQINSQIDILNKDYSGTGLNVSNFSSTNFPQSLIADCNITFCLAEKNPAGVTLAEKGIERLNYSGMGWTDPASFNTSTALKNYIDNTIKPASIWNPAQYLNIWVSDENGSVNLLGYATFPPGSGLTGLPGAGTASDDGIWCWAKAVGNQGFLTSFYNQGRTATHEIGHWLGLRHIWGDASCATDYCNDTPQQQQDNTGCPTFPKVSCNNSPNGELFMNFMDYTYDACMYMFTNDQRTRMQTAMANSPLRNQLTASSATLCSGSFTPCAYTISNFSDTDTLQSYRRATASPGDAGCLQGNGKAGYINGTNCYDDKEKAEFFSASIYNGIVTNPVVTGVYVLFFQYGNMGTDGNGSVGLNIYNGTSASSAPGTLLGSTVENLSTIAATTNTTSVPLGDPNLAFSLPVIMPYLFTFTTPVPVPANGGFFASVLLPNTSGDTVVIMDKVTGTSNTAWEKWSNNSWNDMKTAWGNTRNFNLAIVPVIECGPVSVEERTAKLRSQVEVFPNPSAGNFYLVKSGSTAQRLEVTVYNLLGQPVFKHNVKPEQQHLFEIDLSGQPNGIYFAEINDGTEKIVKRLVVSH